MGELRELREASVPVLGEWGRRVQAERETSEA